MEVYGELGTGDLLRGNKKERRNSKAEPEAQKLQAIERAYLQSRVRWRGLKSG